MDEDDEFGTFEAAEPTEEVENDSGGIQAGPSPWAFFPGAAGGNQPDLIRPPGGVSNNVDLVNLPHNLSHVQDPLEPNFATGVSGVSGMRSFSEQVLEPHFGNRGSNDQPVPDGVLDLDLTNRRTSAERQDDDLDLELEPDLGDEGGLAAAGVGVAAPDCGQDGQPPDLGAGHERPQAERLSASVERQEAADEAGGRGDSLAVGAPQEALELHATQQEKSRLQQELAEMMLRCGRLETDLQSARETLEKQRRRYSEQQTQHARDLEEMRQANHQALAIIVEEYKELCRTVVLEQQEAGQREVLRVLQEEQQRQAQLFSKQTEELESRLQQERSALLDHVKQAVGEHTARAQEEIEARIKDGKAELEAFIQENLKRESEQNEVRIQEAVSKEVDKLQSTFQEEQAKLKSLVEKEKTRWKTDLTAALTAEQENCKECVKTAVREERERGLQSSRDVTAQAQQQVASYIEDHKQRDAAIRKKSLASVELLLSTAQKQLQALMSTVNDVTDTSSVATDTSQSRSGGETSRGNGDQDRHVTSNNAATRECSQNSHGPPEPS